MCVHKFSTAETEIVFGSAPDEKEIFKNEPTDKEVNAERSNLTAHCDFLLSTSKLMKNFQSRSHVGIRMHKLNLKRWTFPSSELVQTLERTKANV